MSAANVLFLCPFKGNPRGKQSKPSQEAASRVGSLRPRKGKATGPRVGAEKPEEVRLKPESLFCLCATEQVSLANIRIQPPSGSELHLQSVLVMVVVIVVTAKCQKILPIISNNNNK